VIDPVTGDLLFSTYGEINQVIEVRGSAEMGAWDKGSAFRVAVIG